MKGHIRKRGERSWAVVVDLGRDPGTGKRRQKWHTVKGTKRDAERELARLVNELNAGQYVAPAILTVGEYLEQWLEDHARHRVRPTTLESYQAMVDHHLLPGLGATRLDRLTPLQLQRFYSAQLAQGRRDGKPGGLSPRTVQYMHACLRQALNQAVKLGLLAKNPAEAVSPPRAPEPELTVWTADQTAAFLEAARPSRYYPLYVLAVYTGLRRGELLGLRWQDVDLTRGILQVRQSLTRTGQGILVQPPKTRQSRRAVVLGKSCLEVLVAVRQQQAQEAEVLGHANPGGYVFTSEAGKPVEPRALTRQFEAIVARTGLPGLTFHGLRHVHATLLLVAGVHPKVAAERLGHSRVGITLDRYSHLVESLQEAATAAVETLMARAREVKGRGGE